MRILGAMTKTLGTVVARHQGFSALCVAARDNDTGTVRYSLNGKTYKASDIIARSFVANGECSRCHIVHTTEPCQYR